MLLLLLPNNKEKEIKVVCIDGEWTTKYLTVGTIYEASNHQDDLLLNIKADNKGRESTWYKSRFKVIQCDDEAINHSNKEEK